MSRLGAVLLAPAMMLLASATAYAGSEVDIETKRHFALANDLMKEARYADALVEYDAAYQAERRHDPALSWKLLYNRAQCLVLLKREPEAIADFERYLAEGGADISEERRNLVKQDIEKLKQRLGALVLQNAPDGSEVSVDGRVVGKTPFAGPLVISAGSHNLALRIPGIATALDAQIAIVAGETRVVRVDTPATPATASAPPVARPIADPMPERPLPPVRTALPAPAFQLALTGGADALVAGANDKHFLGSAELMLAWRVTSIIGIGVFGRGALGSSDVGGSGVSGGASYSTFTGGVRGQVYLLRSRKVDGWAGFDAGYLQEHWGDLKGADGGGFDVGASIGVEGPISKGFGWGVVVRFDDVTLGGKPAPLASAHRTFLGIGLRVSWSLPFGSDPDANAPPSPVNQRNTALLAPSAAF